MHGRLSKFQSKGWKRPLATQLSSTALPIYLRMESGNVDSIAYCIGITPPSSQAPMVRFIARVRPSGWEMRSHICPRIDELRREHIPISSKTALSVPRGASP